MKKKSAKNIKSLVIFAREKHDGSNYYHVVNVYVNNKFIGSKKDIGSCSMSNHYQTAFDVLQVNGYFTENKGLHNNNGSRIDLNEFWQWKSDNWQKIICETAEITKWRDMPETTI